MTAGEVGGHFSPLPLPPTSQTLKQLGDYCRELTFADRGEPETFGFQAQVTKH